MSHRLIEMLDFALYISSILQQDIEPGKIPLVIQFFRYVKDMYEPSDTSLSDLSIQTGS